MNITGENMGEDSKKTEEKAIQKHIAKHEKQIEKKSYNPAGAEEARNPRRKKEK